ncbi:hypothetical protein CP965_05380 [Halarcobacter mediterraneus]|uniref:Lipoprotein n=1 Tax=Halarcobacter mediterraneus TaxID=2023153 RepID=A0A4Q1ATM2_9BACT|nr:hypothetical protein [Halarcobacter mediterraneus]RXK13232.1 hypothetical protein CP965_05380 [Halarcobacter mediterraneus]
MKKTILIGLTLGLVFGFTGCSDKEKKAKDIAAEKIIVDHEKEEAFKESLRKKDTQDYSNAFGSPVSKHKN